MSIWIDNRHPQLRAGQARLARHLNEMLQALGHAGAWVDVSLVTDAEIKRLNRRYRQVNKVTDVLSFALSEAPGPQLPVEILGDIVISLDTAARQALAVRYQFAQVPEAKGYRITEEVLFLATHGLLHLLGHDHLEPAQAEAMEALERQFLAAITPLDVQALDRTEHSRITGRGTRAARGSAAARKSAAPP